MPFVCSYLAVSNIVLCYGKQSHTVTCEDKIIKTRSLNSVGLFVNT